MPHKQIGNRDTLPFLRLMTSILFFPFLLLLDRTLPQQLYYIAGFALLYSALLFALPRLNYWLCILLPIPLIIDMTVISLLIYYCQKYSTVLSNIYLFPIIALSFIGKPYFPFAGAIFAGFSYLIVACLRKYPLPPVIIQITFFFITAYFTRFLVHHVQQAYYKQANQDSLTKIFNRRLFTTVLKKLVGDKEPFSLVLIDLDNFKNLNDTQGHHHGDYVLKIIASILKESTRTDDFVTRYGGDEFAIILPKTPKEISRNIAERIRNNVLINPKLLPYPDLSISIGIASFPENGDTEDTILQKADEALYKAKEMGKNCVFVY